MRPRTTRSALRRCDEEDDVVRFLELHKTTAETPEIATGETLPVLPALIASAPLLEALQWVIDYRQLLEDDEQPGGRRLRKVEVRLRKAFRDAAVQRPHATIEDAVRLWGCKPQTARSRFRKFRARLGAKKDGKAWRADWKAVERFAVGGKAAA